MSTTTPSHPQLFDPVTGDLLPGPRDAYVRGQLAPELAHAVETHLDGSPIQAGIVLGYSRELAARASQQGGAFTPTPWVAQRLSFQATASKIGPLRQPAVRLALGLLLALSLAGVVQWLRNEPLVPAPVAVAAQAAASATRHLVQRLAAPAEAPGPETPEPAKAPGPETPEPAAPKRVRRAAVATQAIPTRRAVAATDSLAGALPTALRSAPAGMVRGRISDVLGRPLPGATVLVKGTRRVASTNATGDYVLEAPPGAALQFGYGGCADQTIASPGTGTLNVTLQPSGR